MKKIYYLTNFSLFNQYDVELLSCYKQFVEGTIIQLGESWRIQSGLLSKQITSKINNNMQSEAQVSSSQRLQFNIFNQFLQPFLKHKIGYEKQECNNGGEEKFTEEVNKHFSLNKTIDSVLFKSLSIGFGIYATNMWVKSFSNISQNQNIECLLIPLGILQRESEKKNIMGQKSSIGTSTIRSCFHSSSQIDDQKIKNYKQGYFKKWFPLKDMNIFSQEEMKGIIHTIKKIKYKKVIPLSCIVVNIHEIDTGIKTVRIISISNNFYRIALIIWLIFNIKLFFSISLEQYLVYFKYLFQNWEPNLEMALKKFYNVIENQWNLLRKDYSVPLHDDLEVLKNLIHRVKCNYQEIWKSKQQQIIKKISD